VRLRRVGRGVTGARDEQVGGAPVESASSRSRTTARRKSASYRFAAVFRGSAASSRSYRRYLLPPERIAPQAIAKRQNLMVSSTTPSSNIKGTRRRMYTAPRRRDGEFVVHRCDDLGVVGAGRSSCGRAAAARSIVADYFVEIVFGSWPRCARGPRYAKGARAPGRPASRPRTMEKPPNGDVPAGDRVAGKKRPHEGDDQDMSSGALTKLYRCANCMSCMRGGKYLCESPLTLKIAISEAEADRALERFGVAHPDSVALRELANASKPDWGVGEPQAGVLVVAGKPPRVGVVVSVVTSAHRKVKFFGRAETESHYPKNLRLFVEPVATPQLIVEGVPLISVSLTLREREFEPLELSRPMKSMIAHSKSLALCVSVFKQPKSAAGELKLFAVSLSEGLKKCTRFPATIVEMVTAANIASKREHRCLGNKNNLYWLMMLGESQNLWTFPAGHRPTSIATIRAGDLRFCIGSGVPPAPARPRCPISGLDLPAWVNTASFSKKKKRRFQCKMRTQKCPGCARDHFSLPSSVTRNTRSLVLAEVYRKTLAHAGAGHHNDDAGAALLRAAIASLVENGATVEP
jgi:hypothetical protein